ncbi:ABC transporter ATP-binding protein [Nocardia jinanensis]|uniref:ABC transporter ATP-binding protein n=1 Tax=Nocardia jinanensis TaxID=382504 RepID=A0A917R4E6_9NOCA|nr:ABC transporter ATP-binding protein [Nocardia jinanensis]GGK89887.1 ABC transporter ATP-binding protein [Nocardia jinanensis]
MSALITLDNVSVTYAAGSRPALSGASLRLEPGQLTLVTGPSGCGKSTLMRVVNGLVPHAYSAEVTGSVTVAGLAAEDLSIRQISETVGTLLQDPAKQVVGHSVLADLAFGLENRGLAPDQIRARVRQVAETLDIPDELLHAATHELSGGQLQLVALAGILVLRPRVIIVDEPLANLDPDAAVGVLRALRDYVDGGGAGIVIEHRVDEVVPIDPDQVIHLEHGQITYSGDSAGFLRVADPDAVRLPFDTLVARAEVLTSQRHPPGRRPGGARLRYSGAQLGYRTVPVLQNVSTELLTGQRIAVLGLNGAGKSTLLRAAVGLVDVLAGDVELEDRPVDEYPAAEMAALIGYLFQNPAQAFFAATVADELAFGPRNLGAEAGDIDEISARALAAVGLSDEPGILDRPPRTLSFGQQRRLALALALTLRPRTLILDEPTAGQDQRSSGHFLDEISALSDIDSVYLITHDIDLALWRSDRVLVVADGALRADGTPYDIVHDESLWHTGSTDSNGYAVLRETDYVRAARAAATLPGPIPSPHELARRLGRPLASDDTPSVRNSPESPVEQNI